MAIYTKVNGEMKQIQAIKTKYNGEMVNIANIMTKINGEMVSIFSTGWKQPADWKVQNIDLRETTPDNSIALLAGVKSDYSAYDNLGFIATCTGGYKVFIDGVQYGEIYASATQCNITWSNYTATQGKNITTPESLIAHEIHIVPATSGNNITRFYCARVADSGFEHQGILWSHFNLENRINLTNSFFVSGYLADNTLLLAITALNNYIDCGNTYTIFRNLPKLSYIPQLKLGSIGYYNFEGDYILPQITIKNGYLSGDCAYCFSNARKLKYVKLVNSTITPTTAYYCFHNNYALKKLPIINYTSATNMTNFLTNAESLQDTILDVRSATGLKIIGCYGSTEHFMTGFKGLRVSNQAPFDYTSSPQINVSYTGMDRQALVQLFNDLPSVNDGQIININGCSGSELLSPSDLRIATNKGWSVIGGPAYKTYATFTGASIGDTIKLNDGMATSNYDYSAYPNDTTLTGEFTKTATATSVDDVNNIIEIAQEPATTENDVIIKTGTIYQEYKDNNDNAVLSEGSLSGNFNLQNASVVGTLTNDNGVYCGFSDSNYIHLSNTFNFNTTSWEIKTKFKTTNEVYTNQKPFHFYKGSGDSGKYGIGLGINRGYFDFFVSSNGSSWLFDILGNHNVLANTTYWVKASYDGTTYKLSYSLDGINYNDDITYISSSLIYAPLYSNFGIYSASSLTNPFLGSIDMKETETSITIDGVKTTFGYSELTSPLYDTNYEPIDITGATFSGDTITLNGIDYTKTGNEIVRDIEANIDVINSTTLNEVNIIYPDNATLKTETQLTSKSNIDLIGYKSVYASVPPNTNSVIESNGVQYSSGNILLKDNQPLTISIRDNSNNLLYINDMSSQRSIYHYQVISFNLPAGETITSTINKGLPSSALSRYAYIGDVIDYETSTGTTGSYVVGYTEIDGKETIINI